MLVTTSWDDSHVCDDRLANLLTRHGVSGTFYVSPRNREIPPARRLSLGAVRDLAANFEIGCHTMTHPVLTKISVDEALSEISSAKAFLEDVIGRKVVSFCYPRGEFTLRHRQMVEQLGFRYARTVRRFHTSIEDPLQAPTSVHAYTHWSDLPRFASATRLWPPWLLARIDWTNLAMELLARAGEQDGIFHLWGHSWEIDQHHDWNRLDRVLEVISGYPGAAYLTNGELP